MKTYTIGQFAKIVHKSIHTLQRWDRDGVLVAFRTLTNRRYYTSEQINIVVTLPEDIISMADRKIIAYCRVSSATQKPDLLNQTKALESFCAAKAFANVHFITEIGGGLNFKRPKFLELIDNIMSGNISDLVIAHKDRLTRFGYDLIHYICTKNNCKIHVLNHDTLSPEQEMVRDLMTIIHCFSSRLYGLRRYRKSLNTALNDDIENK